MKIKSASIIALFSLFTMHSAFATDISTNTTGKEKIGVVSASGASTLDSLTSKLAEKAHAQGATSMKIIYAGGENRLNGVAEIYK